MRIRAPDDEVEDHAVEIPARGRPQTCAIRPPVQYGRPCNTAGHLCNLAACVIRPPVQYGHLVKQCQSRGRAQNLCNTATRAVRPPVQYSQPCNTARVFGHAPQPHAIHAAHTRRACAAMYRVGCFEQDAQEQELPEWIEDITTQAITNLHRP